MKYKNFKDYSLRILNDDEFLIEELECINYYLSRLNVYVSYMCNITFQNYNLDLIYNSYEKGICFYLNEKFPRADYSDFSKFSIELIDYLKENDYWERAIDNFIKLSIKNANYLSHGEEYYKQKLKDILCKLKIRDYNDDCFPF